MQGTIAFDGTLSGSIAGGGGGGSEVEITPVLTTGTKIADYEIDGDAGELFAPTPEALPSSIVTKAIRKYNDTTQTKIATVTTLDTSNNQEVSQDIYAPSPVQCWYTPGLEQDYQIGQFTYGGITQNVYIPYFQRPLTAGANITIDVNNVISAGLISYSTTEQDTENKWTDGRTIYMKTIELTGVDFNISQNGFKRANVELHPYIPEAEIGWILNDASYILEIISDTYYYRNFDFWEWEGDSTMTTQNVGLFKRVEASNQVVVLTVKYVKGV